MHSRKPKVKFEYIFTLHVLWPNFSLKKVTILQQKDQSNLLRVRSSLFTKRRKYRKANMTLNMYDK